jgi:hypothetical protein
MPHAPAARVEELAEVLAARFDSDTTADLISDWRPENTEDAIMSACSILIAVIKVDASPSCICALLSKRVFDTGSTGDGAARGVSR